MMDAWCSGPCEELPTRRRGGRSQLRTEGMMPYWYGTRWKWCWDVQVSSRWVTEMKTGDVVLFQKAPRENCPEPLALFSALSILGCLFCS